MFYSVNEKIRIIRNIRGYKQSYMASKLEISQQDYSYIENHGTKFTNKQIAILSEILEIDENCLEEFNPNILLGQGQNENVVKSHFSSEMLDSVENDNKIVPLLKRQIILLEKNIKGLRNQIKEQNETIKDMRQMLHKRMEKLDDISFVEN